MLSTPPAFNLSQNQTLQLIEKNWQSSSLRLKNLLKVYVPVRSSLVKEPSCLASGNPLYLASFAPAVKNFFRKTSIFFRGTRWCPPSRSFTFQTVGELPCPSGEDGLCSSPPTLSTTFFDFFAFIPFFACKNLQYMAFIFCLSLPHVARIQHIQHPCVSRAFLLSQKTLYPEPRIAAQTGFHGHVS